MLSSASHVVSQVEHHEFHKRLNDGSLPWGVFCRYIGLDQVYLSGSAKAFEVLSKRTTENRDVAQLIEYANYISQTEKKMLSKYLVIEPKSFQFFQSPHRSLPEMTLVSNHANNLLQKAQSAPIEVALSELLPCFKIFQELGGKKATDKGPIPYQMWRASYSSEKFVGLAGKLADLTAKMGDAAPLPIQHQMIDGYVNGALFELNLLDAAYGQRLPSLRNHKVAV